MLDTVGRRIAKLRFEKGMTQRDLAKATGLGQALISRYETGHYKSLRLSTAIKLAKALDTTPDYLRGPDSNLTYPVEVIEWLADRENYSKVMELYYGEMAKKMSEIGHSEDK